MISKNNNFADVNTGTESLATNSQDSYLNYNRKSNNLQSRYADNSNMLNNNYLLRPKLFLDPTFLTTEITEVDSRTPSPSNNHKFS